MRRPAGLLLAVPLLAAFGAGAIAPMQFDSPEQRERFKRLTRELRCMVCQNESLADSDADLAQDMREQVLAMMKAGRSDEEIRGYLVARYGDFILYQPPVKPATWLLWFGPMLLLGIGGIALAVVIRRRAVSQAGAEDGE